jgi:hypothetical protein
MLLVVVGMVLTGAATVLAEPASNAPLGSQLTIIPTGIHQPDVLKINTGKKAPMKDGQYGAVYTTVKPGKDQILLQLTVDLSVEPGPLFLETSMVHLDERSRRAAPSYVPIHWYLDSGPEPAPADTLTIASQARLVFTFEVPAARADNLTLWISGLRVASVPEIRERIRREGERE